MPFMIDPTTGKHFTEVPAEAARLAAENERLRAALKKIVDTFESTLEDTDAAQIMGETAREALTAAK